MKSAEPFALFDCNLARCAVGKSCTNLRELLDVVRTASDATLEHHMMRCALDDHFELYEFPNDLARWCWDALGDDVLGEQLGLIDPYQSASPAALRAALINVVEERLWIVDRVPWCRPGLELHLSNPPHRAAGEHFRRSPRSPSNARTVVEFTLLSRPQRGGTAGRTDIF